MLVATSEPAHPVAAGGIQASAHDLLVGVTRVLGAEARLLSASRPGELARCRERLDELGISHRVDRGDIGYEACGYPATLTDAPAFPDRLDAALRSWRPDVVVAQAAGWRDVVSKSRAAGVPVVHWMHGWLGLIGGGALPEADLLLANSEYTANQVVERFRLHSTVFHPPVEPARVRASHAAGAGGAITMINAHPSKGITIFIELARRLRDRRFVVVDCWGTPPYIERAIRREPNMMLLPVGSDMAEVYGRSAVVVVPTTSDETFGRVVVEAQLNGIPVLASDVGALPGVVGGGGHVVSTSAPIECWVDALVALAEPESYARWSSAARKNAERFDFEQAILRFGRLAQRVLRPGA